KLAYALGTAYAQTRQPAKAREAFARTFRLAPDSAAAHLLAGEMMNRFELEDLAEAELTQAIQMDPKLPDAHYVLAQIATFRPRSDPAAGRARRRSEARVRYRRAAAGRCPVRILLRVLCVLGVWPSASSREPTDWPVKFVDIADRAGLREPSIYGGVDRKRFI